MSFPESSAYGNNSKLSLLAAEQDSHAVNRAPYRCYGTKNGAFLVTLLCLAVGDCFSIAAQTTPDAIWTDLDDGIRLLFAADPKLAPKAMMWLGSERDGIQVGSASPRVRLAIRAVRKFQLKESVPWLIAIYDDPSATAVARDHAAEAAIQIDPDYSLDFLQDVLDDELGNYGSSELLSAAQREAAVVLLGYSDERAHKLLFNALAGALESINTWTKHSGPLETNALTVAAFSRTIDRDIARTASTWLPKYANTNASPYLGDFVNRLQANLQPQNVLERYARQESPDDQPQRLYAIMALAAKGDAACVPIIESVRQSVIDRYGFDPRTAQAPTARTGAAQPSTRPASPATTQSGADAKADHKLLDICDAALSLLRVRLPIQEPLPARWRSIPPPVKRQPPEVPDSGELVFMERMLQRHVNGGVTHTSEMIDLQGILPRYSAVVRDPDLVGVLTHTPYGALGRAVFSENRAEVRAVSLLSHAPGETARDGYVFLKSETVKQGPWENTAVMLSKFGRTILALIPNRHQPNGQWSADVPMATTLAGLTSGECVEVGLETGPGPLFLRYLEGYRPPISAKWVGFSTLAEGGKDCPAVQLNIARKLKTCLLPPEPVAFRSLEQEILAKLPVGAELNVVISDLNASPPKLLAVRLDGGVAQSWDGSTVAVRMGRVKFVAKRESDWNGSLLLSESPESATNLLIKGLNLFLPSPPGAVVAGNVANELRALCHDTGQLPSLPVDDPLPKLVAKWVAADDVARPTLETQMQLRLCKLSVDLNARQKYLRWQARSMLTVEQYREATALARPLARIPAKEAEVPTTQSKQDN
jgi:hypothetical protein